VDCMSRRDEDAVEKSFRACDAVFRDMEKSCILTAATDVAYSGTHCRPGFCSMETVCSLTAATDVAYSGTLCKPGFCSMETVVYPHRGYRCCLQWDSLQTGVLQHGDSRVSLPWLQMLLTVGLSANRGSVAWRQSVVSPRLQMLRGLCSIQRDSLQTGVLKPADSR
jgi:hypothetical protein